MTKEELAARLDGREVGEEITSEEAAEARAADLLVIYGASDDLLEAEGAFRDEVEAPGSVELDGKGFLPWERDDSWSDAVMEAFFARRRAPGLIEVTAEWCPAEAEDGRCWDISTAAPHATFRVMEDGKVFSVGIVLDLKT
jgi:hypothetical protein